jgi:hypothetical protein
MMVIHLQVTMGTLLFGSGYIPHFFLSKAIAASLILIYFHLAHAPAGIKGFYYAVPREEYNMEEASFLGATHFEGPRLLSWAICDGQ